jgi:hypothetical protein
MTQLIVNTSGFYGSRDGRLTFVNAILTIGNRALFFHSTITPCFGTVFGRKRFYRFRDISFFVGVGVGWGWGEGVVRGGDGDGGRVRFGVEGLQCISKEKNCPQ